ncbi:helix-turn-helix domain-containing protein [Thermostichus vulcanus]|uniref:Helix-turn-helix transcriptional regulator n=1 Tax=Thermostichus vulcanus str. 'Rupite' TaxID=2813851 RepID=A0ABT0C730_THEVL|nr:helix-turn-helix transcriptional regulator [Thermostichus vulcanus]MCJ2541588.1 helix-turn-helix transcriptional regulator [Thermostichus vulcanus str. 'Rupite']
MNPLDEPLRQRMQALGIPSWQALRKQAGVSRRAINHLRRGEWGSLRLEQLQQLALALNWELHSLFDLIHPNIHLSSQAPTSPDVTFSLLQPLLTSYPTIRQIAQRKPDWPAQNVTALFRSLDALLHHWNYEAIGSPFESVPFQPQLHQPDQPDIQLGDPVYIRFVGYRQGERILCPAKVSRSLPGGLS